MTTAAPAPVPAAASQRGTTTVSQRAVRRIAEQATAEALPGALRERRRPYGAGGRRCPWA